MAALLLQLAVGCDGDEKAKSPDAGSVEGPSARARLRGHTGDVSIKRAAADDWVSAVNDDSLFENDKVRTAKGATAVVSFANGSEVALGEDALIAIAETRPRPGTDRTDLTVFKGRIDAELENANAQSLTVSTPAATVRAGREIVFQ